ncbi:hypothetical protein ACJX0J_031938 [Zea mays]
MQVAHLGITPIIDGAHKNAHADLGLVRFRKTLRNFNTIDHWMYTRYVGTHQLSGLKINFHKSELFCYGAAKGSLAMFMFSFFEYLKNKTITQATVANVLQHNQLNVAFRRVFTISLSDRRDTSVYGQLYV